MLTIKFCLRGATLQDLPDEPRFVINASNLQSGVLWRFSKPYMRDYKVGNFPRPKVPLAVAVAASSAFPPFLSPVQLRLNAADCEPNSGDGLQCEPYTTRPLLSDGGVYDNLGLESVFKRLSTVLVSDGGAAFRAAARPWRLWPLQLLRVIGCIDNQVRALRKRELIEHYQLRPLLLKDGYSEEDWIVRSSSHKGAYWGIAANPAEYPARDFLSCTVAQIEPLACVPTRLQALPDETQEKLINWGYAICDLALRSYYLRENVSPEPKFPYARGLS